MKPSAGEAEIMQEFGITSHEAYSFEAQAAAAAKKAKKKAWQPPARKSANSRSSANRNANRPDADYYAPTASNEVASSFVANAPQGRSSRSISQKGSSSDDGELSARLAALEAMVRSEATWRARLEARALGEAAAREDLELVVREQKQTIQALSVEVLELRDRVPPEPMPTVGETLDSQESNNDKVEEHKVIEIDKPEDLHFLLASICLAPSANPSPWRGVRLLIGMYFVVTVQCMTAVVLIHTLGNRLLPCTESDDCGPGDYCSSFLHPLLSNAPYNPETGWGVSVGQCLPCNADRDFFRPHELCAADGSVQPHIATNFSNWTYTIRASADEDVTTWMLDTYTSLETVAKLCEDCLSDNGYQPGIAILNARTMTGYHYLVLVLVAFCAAGTVATEARNRLKTTLFMVRHPWSLFPSLDPVVSAAFGDSGPPLSWKVKKALISFLQMCRAVMMIFVITNVALFIIRDAADPASIILNTLSALFILEVDDLLLPIVSIRTLEAIQEMPLRADESELRIIDRYTLYDCATAFLCTVCVPVVEYLPNIAIIGIPLYIYGYIFIAGGINRSAEDSLLKRAQITEEQRHWSRLSPDKVKERKRLYGRARWETGGLSIASAVFTGVVVIVIPVLCGRSDAVFGVFSQVQ